MPELRLAGIDFTCAPSRRKPITVATGRLHDGRLVLDDVANLASLAAFDDWLRRPGPWLGAFDFPFGLPRAFVEANGLGRTCAEVSAAVHDRCPTRMAWRAFIDAWANAQPTGRRLLHRAADRGAEVVPTSPLQTRYVPVGLMYYEGVARLLASGCALPGLHDGDRSRVALEGYPRRVAFALAGRRSYKNSALDDRRATREHIVAALEQGLAFGPALRSAPALRATLVADESGDRLDAVMCLVQAAVASRRPGYGVPPGADPVEGWICAG